MRVNLIEQLGWDGLFQSSVWQTVFFSTHEQVGGDHPHFECECLGINRCKFACVREGRG